MTGTETHVPAGRDRRPDPLDDGSGVAAVALREVTKRFPGAGRKGGDDEVIAVDGVQLDIADGEFFSLLGPSGCGKTTTLRLIGGFEFPTAGSVRIFGDEMALEPPNKRPVNTVFQSYALFPHMTIEDNVGFGLKMQGVEHDERTQRVAEMIELVQLGGREKRRPRQLSGGQQQRVALARALVNHPKVLLLDEPLGALDLKLRQTMQLELKQLQERVGITFVYVTHDQDEALTMSDRIGVMDGGRVLQVGSPKDIYDRPRTRFVADFIGDSNFLALTIDTSGAAHLPDGSMVRVDGDHAAGSTVTAALRPESIGLHGHDVPHRDDLDTLDAEVERVTYLGKARAYQVRTAGTGGAVRLDVRQGNAPGSQHFEVGEQVRARWMPDSLTVLDD